MSGVWMLQLGDGGVERSAKDVSLVEVSPVLESLVAGGRYQLELGCDDAKLVVNSGGQNRWLVRYSAPPVGAWVSCTKGRHDLPAQTLVIDGRRRTVPASWVTSLDDARMALEDFIEGATRSGRLAWVPYPFPSLPSPPAPWLG